MCDVTVYLGLGSNIGDRAAHIERAVALLGIYGITVLERAPLYRTAPWGRTGQADFFNTVVRGRTDASPDKVLAAAKCVESRFTPRTGGRWGPREIDVDILLYGDVVMERPGLEIPHPRIADRRFVLAPLADIAHDAVHPVLNRTIGLLLADTEDDGRIERCDERSAACVI